MAEEVSLFQSSSIETIGEAVQVVYRTRTYCSSDVCKLRATEFPVASR